ncbi:MAG: hypothetical protein ACE5KE_05800 [Methanosarcinales archaeon]
MKFQKSETLNRAKELKDANPTDRLISNSFYDPSLVTSTDPRYNTIYSSNRLHKIK